MEILPQHPIRLLLAEDDASTVALVRHCLEDSRFDVLPQAATAARAVELARAEKPDVLLMDIRLQGEEDGIDAVSQIQQFLPSPVLYMTNFSDEVTIERARATEPFAYLFKPFSRESLLVALEVALERHRAEQRLAEKDRHTTATLEGLTDGVITFRADGVITLANRAAHEIFGAPETLPGRSLAIVFAEAGAADFPWHDPFSLQEMTPATIRDHHGNVRMVEICSRPSADYACSILIVRDVTKLRSLEEHLRQSQKIEAVGRLAAGIAHDFNNLLSVINSYAELLNLKLPRHDPLLGYVKHIRGAGGRATDLVGKLMAFSRREPDSPQVVNITRAIQDIEPLLRRVIRENIEFTVEVPEKALPAEVDPGLLDQALMNLATNARDAMPDGGHLTVRVGPCTLGSNEPSELSPGDYVQIQIIDTGCGMEAETIRKVFDPFFTTKEVGKGTGLGLSTVYGFIKQARGNVRIDSTPGVGTTFSILLPLCAEDGVIVAVPPPENPEELPAADEPARILVVEDDATFAECVTGILEGQGYRVSRASDGAEALERFGPEAKAIPILLTDVVMPRMSGTDLAAAMRERHPDIRVVFMSGYDESVLRKAGEENAILLQKPFSLTRVLTTVKELLENASADGTSAKTGVAG